MAKSNPIAKALQRLQANVLPLVKGYLAQEAAISLTARYDDYTGTGAGW